MGCHENTVAALLIGRIKVGPVLIHGHLWFLEG